MSWTNRAKPPSTGSGGLIGMLLMMQSGSGGDDWDYRDKSYYLPGSGTGIMGMLLMMQNSNSGSPNDWSYRQKN
jgi:hypothetical protein